MRSCGAAGEQRLPLSRHRRHLGIRAGPSAGCAATMSRRSRESTAAIRTGSEDYAESEYEPEDEAGEDYGAPAGHAGPPADPESADASRATPTRNRPPRRTTRRRIRPAARRADGSARPLTRSQVLQARRRLLTLLVLIAAVAGACTVLKLTAVVGMHSSGRHARHVSPAAPGGSRSPMPSRRAGGRISKRANGRPTSASAKPRGSRTRSRQRRSSTSQRASAISSTTSTPTQLCGPSATERPAARCADVPRRRRAPRAGSVGPARPDPQRHGQVRSQLARFSGSQCRDPDPDGWPGRDAEPLPRSDSPPAIKQRRQWCLPRRRPAPRRPFRTGLRPAIPRAASSLISRSRRSVYVSGGLLEQPAQPRDPATVQPPSPAAGS